MVCASVAIVAAGAYLTYRQVLPQEPISDLTLANIEAISGPIILDKDQAGLIPKQRNNPRGEGCIGKSGTCVIRNDGGWH